MLQDTLRRKHLAQDTVLIDSAGQLENRGIRRIKPAGGKFLSLRREQAVRR